MRSPIIATLVAALALAPVASAGGAVPTPASPAPAPSTSARTAAGWSSSQTVQPGVSPRLSFSPTGAAVLGSQLIHHGVSSGTEVDLADPGGQFAASPTELPAPSAGHGAEPLSGVALSSGGSVALSFANPTEPSPVLIRVRAAGASTFAAAQTVISLGTGSPAEVSPDRFTLLSSGDGDILGAGTDDGGALSSTTLAASGTRFTIHPGPRGLTATDDATLALDSAGDSYLAGDGQNGCTAVAFARPHQQLTTTYKTGNCSSATPNIFDAIAATGGGNSGLLSEDVSESGAVASRLLIQVGHDGRFSPATQLGGPLGGPVGLAADADGELTAEWTGCHSGPLVNGRLSLTDCQIDAATGSASRGFSPAAASGSTLMASAPGVTLSAASADRGVVVSRCRANRCGLYAFTAGPGGAFRATFKLAAAGRLLALCSDTHGDLLAVWLDPHGYLYAATASAVIGRWSHDRRLSAQAVAPDDVSAVYGPSRRATVAWSVGEQTDAASYATSGP